MLIDIVRREGVDHLTAYFAPGAYTGQWFETFAAGGDPHRIAAEDLYAVEALSVQVPFAVGRELLEGQLGRDVSAHLREIPLDAELGATGADKLVDGTGHADQAWHLLKSRNGRGEKTGVGWVIAGKLLARKRPKLIPVYDTIVRCQFGAPKRVWHNLHSRLAADDGALRLALADARSAARRECRLCQTRFGAPNWHRTMVS
jgi:hypothetical protein